MIKSYREQWLDMQTFQNEDNQSESKTLFFLQCKIACIEHVQNAINGRGLSGKIHLDNRGVCSTRTLMPQGIFTKVNNSLGLE